MWVGVSVMSEYGCVCCGSVCEFVRGMSVGVCVEGVSVDVCVSRQ